MKKPKDSEKASDRPKSTQGGDFVLNPAEFQPRVSLTCHTVTPKLRQPSYPLSVRQCPGRQRTCAFHVLIPYLDIIHVPAQTGCRGKRIRPGGRNRLGILLCRPQPPAGPLGEGATDSVVSLLPFTSQVLPSVNFACGQVRMQHTLCVTLDLCLLFIIKRRNHQMSKCGNICGNEGFFFFSLCELFGPNSFCTKRTTNISWGEIRSCFN